MYIQLVRPGVARGEPAPRAVTARNRGIEAAHPVTRAWMAYLKRQRPARVDVHRIPRSVRERGHYRCAQTDAVDNLELELRRNRTDQWQIRAGRRGIGASEELACATICQRTRRAGRRIALLSSIHLGDGSGVLPPTNARPPSNAVASAAGTA